MIIVLICCKYRLIDLYLYNQPPELAYSYHKTAKAMKKQEFTTLARFSSFEEAQVIKALLDSMGVDNEIMSVMVARVMPYLANDVRIIGNYSDYRRAKELLDAKFNKRELAFTSEVDV